MHLKTKMTNNLKQKLYNPSYIGRGTGTLLPEMKSEQFLTVVMAARTGQ